MTGRRSGAAWLRWLPLALIVTASLTVLVSGIAHLLDLDRLLASRAWLHAMVQEDRTRAIVLAVLVYTCAVVVSVPASLVLTMICGFLFGSVTGALIAVCSATTGGAIVFSIGRFAARDLILRSAGPRLQRLADGFRRDAFGYIVFFRIVPLFPFWMTNVGPAAFGVSLRIFVLATFLGLLPGALVYAATGAGIEDAIAAHEAAKAACQASADRDCHAVLSLRDLITPTMLTALGALAALAMFSIILRRRLSRRTVHA